MGFRRRTSTNPGSENAPLGSKEGENYRSMRMDASCSDRERIVRVDRCLKKRDTIRQPSIAKFTELLGPWRMDTYLSLFGYRPAYPQVEIGQQSRGADDRLKHGGVVSYRCSPRLSVLRFVVGPAPCARSSTSAGRPRRRFARGSRVRTSDNTEERRTHPAKRVGLLGRPRGPARQVIP